MANTNMKKLVLQQHDAAIPKLLGAHALSACDTVSSLVAGVFTNAHPLGDLSASLNEVTNSCFRLIAMLYDEDQETSLNNSRASIFKNKPLANIILHPS